MDADHPDIALMRRLRGIPPAASPPPCSEIAPGIPWRAGVFAALWLIAFGAALTGVHLRWTHITPPSADAMAATFSVTAALDNIVALGAAYVAREAFRHRERWLGWGWAVVCGLDFLTGCIQ